MTYLLSAACKGACAAACAHTSVVACAYLSLQHQTAATGCEASLARSALYLLHDECIACVGSPCPGWLRISSQPKPPACLQVRQPSVSGCSCRQRHQPSLLSHPQPQQLQQVRGPSGSARVLGPTITACWRSSLAHCQPKRPTSWADTSRSMMPGYTTATLGCLGKRRQSQLRCIWGCV
jgi:hypothetical protein